ncbi:MAG: porin family protein [Pseudolabrys sp.]|nr:porin family protein [Pseudolabrys sp.]
MRAGAMVAGFFVTTAVSFAADLKAPVLTPVHSWDWTGFYAGTHIGNAAASNRWQSATGAGAEFPGSFTAGGLVNGFQAGYNHQWGQWVAGVEAEASLANIDGAARCANNIYLCDSPIDGLGTLTLRGGYAFGRLLAYGKAGGALMHERLKLTPAPGGGQTEIFTGKAWRAGWTVGAGLEYALTPSLAAKVEYDYLDFSGDVAMTGNAGTNIDVALAQQVHLIKVGLNARLGKKSPFERPLWAASGVPSHDWSGAYVGVHAGGAFGKSDWNSADGVLDAFSTQSFAGSGAADGSIFGGQVGYNMQLGPWVIGAELVASWANLDGYAKCATSAAGDSYACHSRINSLYMATGRLGQGFGNFLIYGLAGVATGVETHEAYRSGGTRELSGSSRRTGYVLGSGIEYAFTPALSGKVEYNYIDFGEKSVTLSGATGTSNVAIGQDIHLVKVGLNYKLGADPRAGSDAPLFAASPLASNGWVMEAGIRYFYSNGKSQKDLYDQNPGQVNSRLIYGGLLAHSGEAFVRLDHDSHVFIKGALGLGSITDGSLYDEDMPPVTSPYSNTISDVRDSSMRYGSLDIGYNVLDGAAGSFGPYAGYRYFFQSARGFGCGQAAQGGICAPGGGIEPANVVLTETETWRGAAIGVNSRMNLAPRWRMEVDAAYLPYVDRAGVDNHWARADINPSPGDGRGWGAQVEALLSYAVTPRFSVGVGARYWYFTTLEATTPFPGGGNAPIKYATDRYGTYLQASYKIGGTAAHGFADEAAPRVNWTGAYAGAHIGAGVGSFDWSDPYPAPATGDRVKTGGALGGLQAGYNAQFGQIVAGAELSGSFARLEGTDTCFGNLPLSFLAGFQCENTVLPLGTATARLGYAVGRSMIYGRAGAAVARVNDTLNSMAAGGAVDSHTATDWGWTVGGGLEHALSDRWSVNVDYKYVDFGARSVAFAVPGIAAAVTPNSIDSHQHLMTMGLNYHFTPMSGR